MHAIPYSQYYSTLFLICWAFLWEEFLLKHIRIISL